MDDKFCQSIAALSDSIDAVMLLEEDGIAAYYSKQPAETLPFLMHSTAATKSAILRMQIFTSIMDEDNIIQKPNGNFRYSKISREQADQFFFPLSNRRTLIVSVKGQYDESKLVNAILKSR